MASDLELAFLTLTAKKVFYDNLWRYYDGPHPLVYSRDKLNDIFNEINARFTQNWCAVVIDSTLERIQFRQFSVGDDNATEERLNAISEGNELRLESDDVHLAALVCGESFVVAEQTDNGPRAYYNDPRVCHVFYGSDNPRDIRFAAKWWRDDEQYVRMNLYYPERTEYYVTRVKATLPDGTIPSDPAATTMVQNSGAFAPAAIPVAENSFSRVPVFHFRREHRAVRSELANIIEPQDALNKLLNDMMVAAEFGAFKQRWIITNTNTDNLKNSPNEIWRIPTGIDGEQGVQLGEFTPTDLSNYIIGIDKFANAIAIISRTPKHYFMNEGGDPSGEALIAMEAPLNKKCQKYIDRFSSVWQQLGSFLLELDGASVSASAISPVFDRPETVQPRTESEIRQIDVATGIPLVTTLRDAGWTDAEIEVMQQDKAAEREAANQLPDGTQGMVQAAQRIVAGER